MAKSIYLSILLGMLITCINKKQIEVGVFLSNFWLSLSLSLSLSHTHTHTHKDNKHKTTITQLTKNNNDANNPITRKNKNRLRIKGAFFFTRIP
jgi:hypothetical protein